MIVFCNSCVYYTRKKVIVDPASRVPYEISLWSAKSSTESMGAIIRSTVRKAARLAVYDEMMISVKNHQIPPTMRVDAACLNPVTVTQQDTQQLLASLLFFLSYDIQPKNEIWEREQHKKKTTEINMNRFRQGKMTTTYHYLMNVKNDFCRDRVCMCGCFLFFFVLY